MSESNLTVWARRLVVGWVCLHLLPPASIFAADPQRVELQNIRPATFQGVTPGASSLKDIQKKFDGDELSKKSETQWELEVGAPFRSVELHLNASKVLTRIYATLITPRPLEVTKRELGLGDLTAIEMRDGDRKMYLYFPHRGLRFYLAQVPAGYVKAISLSQLNSFELIRQRGDLDEIEFYQAMYARGHLDDPGKLRLLEWSLLGGHIDEVANLVRDVSTADEFHHRLLEARQSLWTGDVVDISDFDGLTDSKEPFVAASRKIALARLCVFPQVGEGRRASELVREAMEALTPQLQTKRVIEARRLLLEAHIVMVQAISAGPWDRKQQRLKGWLANTESLAKVVDGPSGDPLNRLRTIRRVLDALINVEFEVAHERWESLARTAGQQAKLSTPFTQSEFDLEMGRIHRQLAQLARNRGDVDDALQRAMLSHKQLSRVEHLFWHRCKETELKETQFLLGAMHAISMEDHVAAVRWFETVEPHLDMIHPESYAPGNVGDRLVSMGVSYWEIGKRDKALELTERGRRRIDALVQAGRLPDTSLATAFRNLSVMHGDLGNGEQSAKYIELARSLTPEARR